MTHTRIALLLSSALALAVHLPAQAQDAGLAPEDAQATNSHEIVVTAQKREQLLVDVPQSISVISGDTLENQQATSFQDYLNLVPGLQLDQSTPGAGRLILRGLNTGGVASTVAVYVDETPFGSSSALVNGGVLAGDFDTFDIDRIEVLRGPQGTLYGASSLGGLLKFVTNEPDPGKFEGRARNDRRHQGRGAFLSRQRDGQHPVGRHARAAGDRILQQDRRIYRFDRHHRDIFHDPGARRCR